MGPGDAPGDGQADAAAAGRGGPPRVLEAFEAAEDPVQVVPGDADTVVRDADDDAGLRTGFAVHGDRHAAVRVTRDQRVAEQVHQDLGDPVGIAEGDDRCVRHDGEVHPWPSYWGRSRSAVARASAATSASS